MKTVINAIKKFSFKVRCLFPSSLPVGLTEFNQWADSIINNFNLPTKDEDSIKFVLSNIILRFSPTTAYKSKFYFVLCLRAAGAKQVASMQFQLIKEKQNAAVTATQTVAPSAS